MTDRPPLGSIVIDEFILPIYAIYLDHGAVIVEGKVVGPARAVRVGEYVLFDRHGTEVCRSDGPRDIWWPEQHEGDVLYFTLKLDVADHVTQDGKASNAR